MSRRLRCGLVGFGFIGPHHADAMRRLGFVDVHGICTESAAESAAKAARYHIPRTYATYQELVADPDIDVVDVVTPTYLHHPVAMAAIAAGKHVIVDKPLALNRGQAEELLRAAERAHVAHAVTFNYRFHPMVQQARVMVRRGDLGELRILHGHYWQEWLLFDTDFNWRVEADKSGPAAMMADAGCHWFDLVEHITGLRVTSLLADFTTALRVRKRPVSGRREAFSAGGGEALEDYAVQVPDRGAVLLRFSNGATGHFATSALCAGHRNDLRLEINGSRASLAWQQEQPETLWIGRRGQADWLLMRDPGAVDPEVRRFVGLPGGHGEAWPDAFRNLMREIFEHIAGGRPAAPGFPTFADGLRAAAIADAMTRSARDGAVWTAVD